MIFISHDLAVVRYIADRTAVMKNGQIVEINDTETLYQNPSDDYTRRLLAARM
jgi:ABC-type oligopeptide transport system ATPase subunit